MIWAEFTLYPFLLNDPVNMELYKIIDSDSELLEMMEKQAEEYASKKRGS